MERSKWQGLPLQLFFLTIFPLTILLLVTTFGGSVWHRQAMRDIVGERDERAVRAAATLIHEQLNRRLAAVQSLALQANDRDPDHALADSSFFLSDFDEGLALIHLNGTIWTDKNNHQFWQQDIVLAQIETINTSLATPFLPPFPHPQTGVDVILIIIPVTDNLFATGAFYPTDLIENALQNVFASSEDTTIFIVGYENQLLYQTEQIYWPKTELLQHPGIVGALQGKSGMTYLDVDDNEHVVAYSVIDLVNWALVIEEPWLSVAGPTVRMTEFAPFVLAPALIASLIALWFGIGQIVHPLQALAKKATELGWGNFNTINESVGGIAEIQRLQTELVHMAEKLQISQQGLRNYLDAITTGQEEERQRLAREIHDGTLQSLIALNQRVQLAQLSLIDHPAAVKLVEVEELTAVVIADLRRLTRALRPIYLEDLGLVPALDMLVRDFDKTTETAISFQTMGAEQRLPAKMELTLYRMAQEGLSNVTRHAQATTAILQLTIEKDVICLTIRDDGRGFSVPESFSELAPLGHFGLLGLYERAELIGAQLTIQSNNETGTILSIMIPNPHT
ncbi:MAG TPA: histidine kinase [Anaerolineae bacterium]|nr:histidine kinase [Anaerolineae bacterium]